MKIVLNGKADGTTPTVEIQDGLSQEAMESELRKFYTPEELYGSTTFAERTSYAARKGRQAVVDDGKNWGGAAFGEISVDQARKVSTDLTSEFTPENDEKYKVQNWGERFVGVPAEMAPYMADSAIQGLVYGELFGATGAGAAAIAGQIPPLTAFPEELATIPGAYLGAKKVGQAYGTWMSASRIETGLLFKSMVDNDIDENTARAFSIPAGYAIGAIELLQVKRLIPNFGRAGITKFLNAAVKKSASKSTQTLAGNLGKFTGRVATKLGKTTAIETGQELTQESIGIAADIGASLYEAMANEEGYDGPQFEDVKEQLVETLTSSLYGFPLLGLPTSIHHGVSLHGRDKFVDRVMTKQGQKALNLELTEHIEQASEAKDFKSFYDGLGEDIDDKFANKHGFDNRELLAEAIWNESRDIQGEHIYEENYRKQQESGGSMQGVVESYRSVEQSISRIGEPISTRAKQISPALKNKIRRYGFDLKRRVFRDEKAVKPFLEGYKKMSDRDKSDLDLAFKNSDTAKIDEVLTKNNLKKEFAPVRAALEAIHKRATESGLDVGYIEDYFPRQVKDLKGMLKFFQKQDIWPELAKIIKGKEEKLGRKMSNEEKAELLNTMLRGYKGKAKPGNIKTREISVVTPEINKFYQDSPQALMNYIYKMNDFVEARRFFGKAAQGSDMSEKTLEDSIGNFVLDLLQKGDIKGVEAKDVEDILSARFGQKGPTGITSAVRNISYIETMGSITSAITQLGDVTWSLYKSGFYRTGKAIAKKLTGRSEISREDVGIERIAEEFSDKSKSANAVNKVFKMVGLDWMDSLGKETFINALFDKFKGLARKEKPASTLPPTPTAEGKVIYHGTTKQFTEAKPSSDYDTGVIDTWIGVHYSESPEIANTFATKEGGSVIRGEINPKKTFELKQTKYANGEIESDQWALQRHIGETVFKEHPDLAEQYLKKQGLSDGRVKTILDGGVNKYLENNGLLVYGDLGKDISKAYVKIMKAKGYENIKYQNTAPMEIRGVTNKTSYIKLSTPTGEGAAVPTEAVDRSSKLSPKETEVKSKFRKEIEGLFGDEADQVVNDLQKGVASENVKFLLFTNLADFQPIDASEMPEGYLKGGNARILYMLKTYTLKQIDIFRNEVFIDMHKRPAEALGNLVRLAALFTLCNASADVIKDLILGRPLYDEDDDEGNFWAEKFIDYLLRIMGLTKYSLYKFKRDGIAEGVSSIVLPPIFNFITRGGKDVDKAMKDDGEFEPHQAEIIQSVPLLGKLYYWWFGGGRKKIEDKE